MSGEVCMFDKFGFCKWNTSCTKVHLKEHCLLEECESRKCQKRHPRPCKLLVRGYCKYGENCRFDHRPPKYLRSLVCRLEALEKENINLLKVIECQDEKINKLQEKANATKDDKDEKSLERLQKQVDQLVLANKKKTEWIKQIDRDLDGMNQFCKSNTETIYERLDDLKTNEDEDKEVAEVELDEKVVDEDLRERAQIFIKRSLTTLENMEEDVKQCRKNGKDVREKYRFYCNQIIKDGSEELDTNFDRHKN